MDAKAPHLSPTNFYFRDVTCGSSSVHSHSAASTVCSPIKPRHPLASTRLEKVWRDIEKSIHPYRHSDMHVSNEAKFHPGDLVLVDVVARSGAQQQVWGEVVRFKHGCFVGEKYEIRVIKRNVPGIVYDRSPETGEYSYIEQDAWFNVSKNTFETIPDCDGIRLCKTDPEHRHA